MTARKIVHQSICKLVATLGVDRAIAFTVLSQGWLSIAGLIGLAAVGKYLSPEEQGYYYTFYSLLALQTLAELGLSNVILQFASHEAAHLDITSRGIQGGARSARSRLASILHFSLRWYVVAAIVLVLLLIPAGFYFFATYSAADSSVAWQMPWILTVIAASGFLLTTPFAALLQGCGMVAEIAKYRLLQAIAAHTALWSAILLGAGLAAASIFAATNVAVAAVWLVAKYRSLIWELLTLPRHEVVDWRTEIWPYQWRIAISWLCGYFIFQIFTPLIFAFHGPVEAGRMGMSLTIAAAVSAMGMSWLSTKTPRMGALVSLKRFDELHALFFRSTTQAICVSLFCAAAIVAISVLIQTLHHPFANRILPTWPIACLLLANVVNLIVTAEATYLRAFKQEPFLVVSIANALFTTLGALLLAKVAGPSQVAFGYLAVDTLIGLGFGTWIFQTSIRRRQFELGAGDRQQMQIGNLNARIAA